jgi:DNA-directed RNA polymerase subunit H (RpoH/RPB5)
MSKRQTTELVNLLRNSVRMVLARGYDLDSSSQSYYKDLENPHLTDAFVYSIYGNIVNSPTMPVVNESTLKMYIYEKFIAKTGNTNNIRMLMSDVFYHPIKKEYCMLFFGNLNNPKKDTSKDDMTEMLTTYSDLKAYLLTHGQKLTSAIYVTKNPLAAIASGNFDTIRTSLNISKFVDNDMKFNPTTHLYNGNSRILTGEPLKKFLENGIDPSKMPRADINEAVVKYLGGVPGDILEQQTTSIIPDVLVPTTLNFRLVKVLNDKKRPKRTANPL